MGENSAVTQSKWLDAMHDPLASLYTFSPGVALCDLLGDGDHKLIVADLGTGKYNMKLKVYKGVALYAEQALTELPTAVSTFISEQQTPSSPAIAVTSGPHVFIYKNLKPFFKYSVPSEEVEETEKDVWMHASAGDLDTHALSTVLSTLSEKNGFGQLALQSQRYLLCENDDRAAFIERHGDQPLRRQSTINCMATLKRCSQDATGIDTLVLGCENGQLLFVDAQAFTLLTSSRLPAATVALHASGLFDVDYRLLVLCRDGKIYTVKRDMPAVDTATISLSSYAVGMTKAGKQIIVACVDHTLRWYSLRGRRLDLATMPCAITAIELLDYEPRGYQAVIVGLENRTLRIYQDTFLVDMVAFDDVPVAARFGKFGREDGALITVLQSGALHVKLFKRTAVFEHRAEEVGAPAAQMCKLDIPKRSKVFVDQTMRERDEAQRMHQVYQRDLFTLRLQTARAYCKVIDQGLTPVSLSADAMIKLAVELRGFGPNFLMLIYLQTLSVQAAHNYQVTFSYNPDLYKVHKPIIVVASMVPGIQYSFETQITCLEPDRGMSGDINVLVLKAGSSAPCIMAQVTMPVSEQSLVD